jgi:hypothetical protein
MVECCCAVSSMRSVNYAECRVAKKPITLSLIYAKCRYAECQGVITEGCIEKVYNLLHQFQNRKCYLSFFPKTKCFCNF